MRLPDTIVVSVLPGDRRAAWLAGGVLIRYAVDTGGESEGGGAACRAGDIILGRVVRVQAALAAAFVDIGDAAAGFLMLKDCPAPVSEGERVLVQVTRAAEGAKGAKLSGRIRREGGALALAADGALADARPPRVLERAPDAFVSALRAGAHPGLARIVADDQDSAAAVRAACPAMAEAMASRIEIAGGRQPAFLALGIEEQLEAALRPTLALRGGGAVTISETPALVAIDIDAGATAAGDARATALACNLEAIATLPLALELRALGGHIVIDAVPMRDPRDRARLLAGMRAAFAGDARQTDIAGFTRLGLIEMTRAKAGPSLRRQLSTACTACDGEGVVLKPSLAAGDALRAALAAARASPGLAPLIVAPAPVIWALRRPMAAALAACEARLGRPIEVEENAAPGPGRFRIEAA